MQQQQERLPKLNDEPAAAIDELLEKLALTHCR
jgi:hypothetical protein